MRSERRESQSHRLSILWQTWSPGIIGIRTTREQISWEILQLKINSFYIGEELCLVDHSIDQIVSGHYTYYVSTLNKENFQVKHDARGRKTKSGEKIHCQENRFRLKTGRGKVLNKQDAVF